MGAFNKPLQTKTLTGSVNGTKTEPAAFTGGSSSSLQNSRLHWLVTGFGVL